MRTHVMSIVLGLSLATTASAQSWVEYSNESDLRMVADGDVGLQDSQEKDYVVGDLDQDGDDDLICVRKEPFTSSGSDINILFMNEGGVLVDRTEAFASSSDVDGDEGFLTPTNDRDVELVDVNGDGWLDVVTCTTLTDNSVKHLSHPRIYINLGEEDGVWLGLRHEDARMPEMHATAGPRFCSVTSGDIDDDGDMDLYFGDYDSGTTQIFDYNNRLLVNDGNGYFTDESFTRLSDEMRLSAFGAASVMADMNNDGALDIVKQTSLNPPQHVAVTWNDPVHQGVFTGYTIHDELAPYFVEVGDLNSDGMLDMVVVDDGVDSYYLNQGNGSDGYANFAQRSFSSITGGFGGDAYCTDLNNDGNLDVIITDVDVDIPGCGRTTHILRNRGESPEVTFSSESTGIPGNMLTGVHDVGIIDLNGDGYEDLVIGRCTSTQIWMNVPPIGIVFDWDGGIPSFVTPGENRQVRFEVQVIGGGTYEDGTAKLYARTGGGDWEQRPVTHVGGLLFAGDLPAVECAEEVEFYIEAQLEGGSSYTDPSTGAAGGYVAVGATGMTMLARDDFEEPATGWSVENDPELATGAWEQVDPIGTLFGTTPSQPEDDATAGADAVMCWITQNGSIGGSVGEADVDGGPTILMSPAYDLDGTDGTFSWAQWFYDSEATDSLIVEVSADDGATWTHVAETFSTNSVWQNSTFRIGEFVVPGEHTRIRWVVEDGDSPSVVEAGVDNIQLDVLDCEDTQPCLGDLDDNGAVDVDDVLGVLSAFGDTGDIPEDLNGDGVVDVNDLLMVISAWGDC